MGSIFKLIISGITLLVLVGMLVIMYFISLPGEVPEKIGGKEQIIQNKGKSPDLLNELEFAVGKKKKIILTEAQVNHYLDKQLKVKQGGFFKRFLTIKGMWVKFSPDVVDFYIGAK